MMKLTAAATAVLLLAGGLAFGATQPDLTASRSEVASAVTSSCGVSQSGCLSAVRTWVEAAAVCREQEGQPETCVCSREILDIARGLGDAALYIKSTDVSLFAMVASTVNDGAPGCFAGAFAQIALPPEDNDGDVGSPG